MKNISVKLLVLITIVFGSSLSAQNKGVRRNIDFNRKQDLIYNEKSIMKSTNDSVLSLLGRWAWGPCYAVDTKDNYAYIGNGCTFQILDISYPINPQITGEYITPSIVVDIHIRDQYAYVTNPGRFMVFDISDVYNPAKIGEVYLGGGADQFALSDSFAYVLGSLGGVIVVDISNPTTPYLRGSHGTGGDHPSSICAYGHYIVVSHIDYSDFMIIDATDPDNLVNHFFDVGGWGRCSYAVDTVLYTALCDFTGRVFLRSYSVVNPLNPTLLGSYEFSSPLWSYFYSMMVKDSLLYLTKDSTGLHVFNINDVYQPVHRGNFNMLDCGDLSFNNEFLYMSAGYGMKMIQVVSADSINYKGFFPTGGTTCDIVLKDSIVYATSGHSGLWIIDISNPQEPVNVSNLFFGGRSANRISVAGDTAFILASGVLYLCDISNTQHPFIINKYGENYKDLAVGKDFVYVTRRINPTGIDTIMEIIDVKSDTTPKRVGYFLSLYDPNSIAVNDSVAFLACSSTGGGLRLINIKNPMNPQEISYVLDVSRGICLKDTIAYTSWSYLYSIDISNPLLPIIIDTMLETSLSYNEMKIQGNYLYGIGAEYLKVIDISNLFNPHIIGSFFPANYVATEDNIVIASYSDFGFYIFKNTLIIGIKNRDVQLLHHRFELYPNYPNPFNGSTTIRYYIPHDSKVELTIFNILGQEVRTLINKQQMKGNYSLVWDGKNNQGMEVSSGVYIYRLTSESFSKSRKLLFLK